MVPDRRDHAFNINKVSTDQAGVGVCSEGPQPATPTTGELVDGSRSDAHPVRSASQDLDLRGGETQPEVREEVATGEALPLVSQTACGELG